MPRRSTAGRLLLTVSLAGLAFAASGARPPPSFAAVPFSALPPIVSGAPLPDLIPPSAHTTAGPRVANTTGPLKEVVLQVKNIKKPNLSQLDKDVAKIAKKQFKNLAKHGKGSADFVQVSDQVQNSGFFATLQKTKGNTYKVASGNRIDQASWKEVDSNTWALQAKQVKKPFVEVVDTNESAPDNLDVKFNANGQTVKTKAVDNNTSQADNLNGILSGKIILEPDEVVATPTPQPTATPAPTAVEPTPTPVTTQTSYNEPDPFRIQLVPVNIPNYSTIDMSTIQQQVSEITTFYNSYTNPINDKKLNIQITVNNPITVNASQISTIDAPCSDSFTEDEQSYFTQNYLASNFTNIMIDNNFSDNQCASANAHYAGATSVATINGKNITWTVINYPFDSKVKGQVVIHEVDRELRIGTQNLASCDTQQCVSDALNAGNADTGTDVTGGGSGGGGLDLYNQQATGVLVPSNLIHPAVGNNTYNLEPRAKMDAGLKGIDLPFTVNGQKDEMLCGEDAPVGGDSAVTNPQLICTVSDEHLGTYIADPDAELPPLNAGNTISDAADGWTLTDVNNGTNGAQVQINRTS